MQAAKNRSSLNASVIANELGLAADIQVDEGDARYAGSDQR
jgi:hypothetical protein